MKLEEFKEIKAFDEQIQALRDAIQQQYNNECARLGHSDYQKIRSKFDIIDKFRSSFRRKMKKLSDNSTTFSSTKNGAGSFNRWKEGFEFAVSMGNTWDIIKYANFHSSPTALFFYRPETVDKIIKELDAFHSRFKEINNLLKVCEIMTA